ncbi:MAG: cytidine deaminase [Chryseolinea sp.]
MTDFQVLANEMLTEQDTLLVRKAREALVNAYVPYSSFRVGVALLLENGMILTGTNQENAAYPSGMCAERVALYSLAAQHPGQPILKMVVVAQRTNSSALAPATSCGSCRQVMLEFEQRQTTPFEVLMLYTDNEWIKASSAQSLLPYCFSKSSLEEP